MRIKLLLLLTSLFCQVCTYATNFSVTISGFSYTPDILTVNVGDVVTIEASGFHPLVQVSANDWSAGNPTQLPGGFNSTVNFNLTITQAMAGTTIYYGCSNHMASSSMKGSISVNLTSSVSDNNRKEFNFTVFPNPVTDNSWLNISLKKAGKTSLTLYDLNGKLVHRYFNSSILPSGEQTIPFKQKQLPKGTYIMVLQTESGVLRKQLSVL